VAAFAFISNTSSAFMLVRVTLDGVAGNPIETLFASGESGPFSQAHAALFAFPSVAPGTHTVAMEFASNNGTQVFLLRPAMRIDHK
jgi:hypothetical protein